ncbi:MAG: segregation/condensation protein A [Pseudomonadota bacterium]
MTELVTNNEEYQVTLDEFEGPLDLLLHLIKKHELEILNIPVAFVTEKYLEFLDLMRSLNLDVAGEYLLMAATLCHMKSRELLPKRDLDEEDEEDDGLDPRQELIRRLLEYQRYKEAADRLAQRPALGRQIFGRGIPNEPVDPNERGLAEVGTFALLSAMGEVIKRNKIKVSYDVVVDRISLVDRINEIVDRLAAVETIEFLECFDLQSGMTVRQELVVTFLAILEMTRLRMIRVLQNDSGRIYITRTQELKPVDAMLAEYA